MAEGFSVRQLGRSPRPGRPTTYAEWPVTTAQAWLGQLPWSVLESAALAVAVVGLHVPVPASVVLAALVLGVVPLLGRVLWLSAAVLLAVVSHGNATAGAVLLVGLFSLLLRRRALRRRRTPARRAHGGRLLAMSAAAGLAVAALPGLLFATGAGLLLSAGSAGRRSFARSCTVATAVILLALVPLVAGEEAGAPAVQPPPQAALPWPAPGAKAHVQVLYVHGLGEPRGHAGDFAAVFAPLQARYGRAEVSDASYYQDLADRVPGSRDTRSCAGPSLTPPVIPTDLVGRPLERDSINSDVCDSESDLGLDVLALSEQVRALHARTGQRVLLMGFSMGGAIIRGLLTLSALRHDGLVDQAVDSVVLVHAVTQGARVAGAGQRLGHAPLLGPAFTRLARGTLVDPHRPALRQLQPRSAWFQWLATNAAVVPELPTFTSYGDVRVRVAACLYLTHSCTTVTVEQLGDLAVLPGADDPAALPAGAGARYLPGGRGPQRWQWREVHELTWDPEHDPLSLRVGDRLVHIDEQHYNILTSTQTVTVADCRTGQPIRLSDELTLILLGRASGDAYDCRP